MMTPKSLVQLTALTLAAVGIAIVTSQNSSTSTIVADYGKAFAPEVVDQAKSIAKITVDSPTGKTAIERSGSTFIDASGFPVKDDVVRKLTASVALLTIEERKTDRAERHRELELAAPDAKKGAGTRITLATAGGTTIADLMAGNRDFTVGGTSGGQFVRRATDTQTYLVRGHVELPGSRSGWFDTTLTTLPEADITEIAVAGKDVGFALSRTEDALTLSELPEGRVTDEAKVKTIAQIFAPLSFIDVRKAGSAKTTDGPELKLTTKSGLVLDVVSLQAEKDKNDDNWFRIAVSGTGEDGEKTASELAKKLDGFEFALTSSDADVFWWKVDALTKEAGKQS